jgi:hypothetical protein
MIRQQVLLTLSTLLLICSWARAAELPVVQVQVEPKTVTVGEPVILRISVFAPTWFPEPPVFPSFELPNTITRLPPNSSGPVSRQVGRSTWSGIQRRYQVFPLVAGKFQIQSRKITVTYADPESRAPISVDIPVSDIVFNSQVPVGAELLDPYLAGQSFDLSRSIDGDTEALAAGDALIVRYRAVLEGLPSMFLPPLFTVADQPGLSIYSEEPSFSDDDGRAIREETITLVFETGGEFSLPALELRWWNLRTGAIEATRIEASTIAVSGPTSLSIAGPRTSWSAVLLWFAVVGIVALTAYLLRGWVLRLKQTRQLTRARYVQSESHTYEQLAHALRNRDDQLAFNHLLNWLWRLDSSIGLDEFSQRFGDESLTVQLDLLRLKLAYSNESCAVDHARLAQALRRARDSYQQRRSSSQLSGLPALNP